MRAASKVGIVATGLGLSALAALIFWPSKASAKTTDEEDADTDALEVEETETQTVVTGVEDTTLADVADQTGADVVVEDQLGNVIPGPLVDEVDDDEEAEDVAAAEDLATLDNAAGSIEVDEDEAVQELLPEDDDDEILEEVVNEVPVAALPAELLPPPPPPPPALPPEEVIAEPQPDLIAKQLQALLLAAEQSNGWKLLHRAEVRAYQESTGLTVDGDYGPATALHLGLAVGNPVPIVRYWPSKAWGIGSPPYLEYLAALKAAGLDSTREKGQGFGRVQKAVK